MLVYCHKGLEVGSHGYYLILFDNCCLIAVEQTACQGFSVRSTVCFSSLQGLGAFPASSLLLFMNLLTSSSLILRCRDFIQRIR